MKARIALLFSLAIVFAASTSFAQRAAPKDPQAVSLLRATLSALSSNITNVTLTGTVTRTAGSDIESGAVTLEGLGGGESRVEMMLTDGPRVEVINQGQGGPKGKWSGPDGAQHAMAQHNSLVPAAWFFPALALGGALNDAVVAVSYIGQETLSGVAVQHVRFWRVLSPGLSSAAAAKLFEHVTTADVYLDAANSLPVALDFNIHPDKNELLDIPVEIRYTDYQKINGILLPSHVQKFINNSLLLDMYITGAEINTNLSPSDFDAVAANQ